MNVRNLGLPAAAVLTVAGAFCAAPCLASGGFTVREFMQDGPVMMMPDIDLELYWDDAGDARVVYVENELLTCYLKDDPTGLLLFDAFSTDRSTSTSFLEGDIDILPNGDYDITFTLHLTDGTFIARAASSTGTSLYATQECLCDDGSQVMCRNDQCRTGGVQCNYGQGVCAWQSAVF